MKKSTTQPGKKRTGTKRTAPAAIASPHGKPLQVSGLERVLKASEARQSLARLSPGAPLAVARAEQGKKEGLGSKAL